MRELDFRDNFEVEKKEDKEELKNITPEILWEKIKDLKPVCTIVETDVNSINFCTINEFNTIKFLMINKDCPPKYWLCRGLGMLSKIINEIGENQYENIIYGNNEKTLNYKNMPLYFLEMKDKGNNNLYLISDILKDKIAIGIIEINDGLGRGTSTSSHMGVSTSQITSPSYPTNIDDDIPF